MKLLLLIPELGYGGAESALLRLAEQLGQSHAVTIAVFQRSYQETSYKGPPISTTLPVLELDHAGTSGPRLLPKRLRRWWRRARELRRLKAQHEVAISFLSGANLLNALVRAGRPCIVSERGSKQFDQSRSQLTRLLWHRLLDPLTYRRADCIVCVSAGLTEEVRSALPRRNQDKVCTISGYIDPNQALTSAMAPIEPELLILGKRPLLVAAGRLHHQKGFQWLLPLFARVAAQVPGSGLLLIGDGPQQQELLQLARSLGLSVSVMSQDRLVVPDSQVIFLGYRSEPARYTRLGRAFVCPSLWEGLPNVLLEALTAGCWCLAADCPWGPAEILTEPDLGRLLPAIQVRAHQQIWETALLEALKRPSGLLLPEERRRAVAERFSIQASAQRWKELLIKING